jgi:hypothetical protein
LSFYYIKSVTFPIPDSSDTSDVISGTKGTIDAYVEWSSLLNKPTNILSGITAGSHIILSGTPSSLWSADIALDATHLNTINTIVSRDASGNFSAGTITATLAGSASSCSGNAATSTKLENPRNISLSGDVSGTASFDGSANISINSTVANNSHTHDNTTVDSLDWSKILSKPAPAITVTLTGDTTGSAVNTFTNLGNGTISVNTTLASTGVSANTYKSVTVDAKGRVTAGTNPTTLSGYGITDAINVSQKGVANGIATLGPDGLVPAIQLPSYVDDILEFANLAAFPGTGETSKIYIALDTNKTYRWSGSVYVYITSGAVDSVAGKTGVVALVKADVGLANVDNTSDLNKPISTATQTALNLKASLDSPALTGTPTTPTAVVGTNTTQIASTAYVKAEINNETYSKTQLNAGQLDNRYYTETELNSGVLDTRYYTEAEIDTKLAAQNDASEIVVVPTGNLASTNVQAALVELQGDIDNRYIKTETDILLAGKASLSGATFTGAVSGTTFSGTSFNSITALSSTTPLVAGTATIGTSTTVARADHVHPVQTSVSGNAGTATVLATARTIQTNLASTSSSSFDGSANVTPGVTGTLPVTNGGTGTTTSTGSGSVVLSTSPTLVTPSLGVATGTSFNSITGLSSTTPAANGTAAVGTSTTVARADHVHPRDSSKLDKSGGVLTGALTAVRETKVEMAANDIDLASGNLFTKTIVGDTTFTISNVLASGNANSFILELTNGGSAVITWWGGMKWAGGTAPTLTASGVDILGFYSHDGGTTWRGVVLSKDSK